MIGFVFVLTGVMLLRKFLVVLMVIGCLGWVVDFFGFIWCKIVVGTLLDLYALVFVCFVCY